MHKHLALQIENNCVLASLNDKIILGEYEYFVLLLPFAFAMILGFNQSSMYSRIAKKI